MQSKRVIITGATKGIGRAISLAFAETGSDLMICARTEKDLLDFKVFLQKKFPDIQVFILAVDLSKKEEVQKLAHYIQSSWSHFDILVNNAGYFAPGGILDGQDGDIEKMMAINFYSAYYLTQSLLPQFIKQNTGHVFNVCSIASIDTFLPGINYSISKFALMGFSLC